MLKAWLSFLVYLLLENAIFMLLFRSKSNDKMCHAVKMGILKGRNTFQYLP